MSVVAADKYRGCLLTDISKTLLLLPGDGIGPEIMDEAEKVLRVLSDDGLDLTLEYGLIGGAAYDEYGTPLPADTLAAANASDAILMGSVGAPKYDTLERALRPETGLLEIRKQLGLFANLRPVLCYQELSAASTLRPEVVADLDIMIVRELTGGIYFGQPRGVDEKEGQRIGFNTMVYSEYEIERIARIAFDAARQRRRKLCSVDKANVLEVSGLWREVVTTVAADYPDVELSHLYVDNAAMQLVREPTQFDVIVTGNMFGDILSDLAAMLTGSIGMLPSASLNHEKQGLYEPVHGSAPDIVGSAKANPLAMILSLAMALRYSLDEIEAAERIEQAVAQALGEARTEDLASNVRQVTTAEMGNIVSQMMRKH